MPNPMICAGGIERQATDAELSAILAQRAAAIAAVPQSVTPAQFWRQCARMATPISKAQVVAMVTAQPDSLAKTDTLIWLAEAISYDRQNAQLVAIAKDDFGMTDAQIDDFFRAAAQLK